MSTCLRESRAYGTDRKFNHRLFTFASRKFHNIDFTLWFLFNHSLNYRRSGISAAELCASSYEARAVTYEVS
jgi:hypothetical protein